MKKYILSIIGLFAVSAATAEDTVISQIVQNNNGLQESKYSYEAQTYDLKSQNNLNDPEVEMSYLFSKPKSIELSATETFDWPGIYGARSRYASHRISAFEYLYQSNCVEVAMQAKSLVIDLVYTNRKIALQKSLVDSESKLLSLLEAKEAKNEITIIEMNKLRLELLDNKNALKSLNVEKNMILADLKTLNGGKDFVEFDSDRADYAEQKIQPLDFYLSEYRDFSPEYKALVQQQNADKEAIKVAKYANYPGFTLGYRYKDEDGVRAHGFVVGMSIPIFSSRHKVKAAKMAYSATMFAESNGLLQGEAKVRKAYNSLLAQEELIAEYKPFSMNPQLYSLLDKALDAGQISLRDYIVEARDLKASTLRLYDMERDYHLAVAELTKYDVLKGGF